MPTYEVFVTICDGKEIMLAGEYDTMEAAIASLPEGVYETTNDLSDEYVDFGIFVKGNVRAIKTFKVQGR